MPRTHESDIAGWLTEIEDQLNIGTENGQWRGDDISRTTMSKGLLLEAREDVRGKRQQLDDYIDKSTNDSAAAANRIFSLREIYCHIIDILTLQIDSIEADEREAVAWEDHRRVETQLIQRG
jgi:hypothetical protein